MGVGRLPSFDIQRPAEFLKELSQGTDNAFDRVAFAREYYHGAVMSAGDYSFDSASEAISRGDLDVVAFGRDFLANPDLPLRFRCGAHLNMPNPDTFYTPGPQGYIDYPILPKHYAAESSGR